MAHEMAVKPRSGKCVNRPVSQYGLSGMENICEVDEAYPSSGWESSSSESSSGSSSELISDLDSDGKSAVREVKREALKRAFNLLRRRER